MHVKPLALLLLICSLAGAAAQQTTAPPAMPDEIGQINFFGYAGLPLDRIRAGLPLHPGDHLLEADFEQKKASLDTYIQQTTGHPLTDMGVVCCDQGKLLIYLGLAGSSSHPMPTHPAPTGSDHLSPEATALYAADEAALVQSVTSGNAGEDDTVGYSLSADPAARKIQLTLRTYALAHTPELLRVLLNASAPKQREAAALLLGYAQRSPDQIAALVHAMSDSDFTVRNNATRSLAVLSAATGSDTLPIPAQPFIDLLFSPTWTDRNKASFLLARMADPGSPALFHELQTKALQPLIEGASWTDAGHANPFLIILRRVESTDAPPSALTPADRQTVLKRALELQRSQP